MRGAVLDFERHVALDGCFNFRDLGSYRTSDGCWTRPQQLYRADGPHALTDADGTTLRGLELRTVIDLRTFEEVEQRGCYATVLSNVVEYHLPMIDVLPHPDELPAWVDPSVVARRYRDMLDGGHDSIAEILAVLSDPSAYPVVFHCSAGKDRTGLVAAVMLGIVGVPDATIVADYALSRAPMRRLLEHYQTAYPHAAEQLSRAAPAMVAADPRTMSELIDGVRRDFGDFEGYASALGIGTAPRLIREAVLI